MTTAKRIVSSVEPTSPETNAGWMRSAVDRVARTWVFQVILRQLDTFLWIVEKSAEWSLPRNEAETEESMKTDLVRPLPWMLFLPMLLFLRMIRTSLNMVALMLGLPRVSSTSMVRFAQKSRYRLANIGNTSRSSEKMRFKRDTQDKSLSMNQAKKALIRSIRLTLSTLSCLDGSKPSLSPPPTRIHISALDLDAATRSTKPTLEEKQRQEVKSDVSTETKLGRNDQLVPELCNSHDVNITDKAIERTEEKRSCEEKSYDGRNKNEETTEESNVEEDESDKEEECDQEKGGRNEYDEEEGSKVECDKAECDLIEQPGSLSTEDNSSEKTPALSQDSDAHFFSPVESSASRSRSSSNSSTSNDIPRQPVSSSSTSPVQNSHQRNTLKTNEYGNGDAHFITRQTTPDRKIDVTKNQTGRAFEEANNGTVMSKRGTNASKYHHHHHRGKRTSHGNRKKK
ncbi:uncharacterized protein LOC116846275 [Odontomachus brunneus]|uniref:uncharacterized protein LOC116846275 n=1 Tax=Odontomachus brunneus TaxID=486640 RepID=UPI0013F19B0F|nr:uncharacterized protein LOC116846275 [Odontomachus brunneus]